MAKNTKPAVNAEYPAREYDEYYIQKGIDEIWEHIQDLERLIKLKVRRFESKGEVCEQGKKSLALIDKALNLMNNLSV